MERFDPESAKEALSEFPDRYDKLFSRYKIPEIKCIRTMEGHAGYVSSVSFSPDGRYCLSGSDDKTIQLWDVLKGECIRTMEGHTEGISSISFSPDRRFCLSGSYDNTIMLWEFIWELEFDE